VQSKFGGHSALFDGTGDRLNTATSTDFAFGTDAWTIEMWIRPTGYGVANYLYDQRTTATAQTPALYIIGSELNFFVNGSNRITSNTTINLNTWYHIAVTRTSGGLHRMFINGVLQSETWTNTTTYIQGSTVLIGERYDGSFDYSGYIDDLRIVKGTALYTANFTAPTSELTEVTNTVLLLNMNVVTNTTSFFDTVTETFNYVPLVYTSQSTITATISHIEGADIIVNGFATLSAIPDNRTRDMSVTMSSSSSLTALNTRVKFVSSSIAFFGFFTADNRRLRLITKTLTVTTALTAVSEKYKTFGRTTISAAFALSATGFEAPADPPAVYTLQNNLLWHFDSAQAYVPNPEFGITGYSDVYQDRFLSASPFTSSTWTQPPSPRFGDGMSGGPSSTDYGRSITGTFSSTGNLTIDLQFLASRTDLLGGPGPAGYSRILALYPAGTGNLDVKYELRFTYTSSTTVNFALLDAGTSVGSYSQTVSANISGPPYTAGSWIHLALQRRGTEISLWVNGVKRIAYTTAVVSLNSAFGWDTTGPVDGTWYGSKGAVDELRIKDRAEYISSFSPPTSAYGLEYDVLIVKQLFALLESRTTLTATGLNVQFGTASMASTATAAITPSRIRPGSANVTARFIQLTVPTRTASNITSNFVVTATQTASAQRARLASAALSSAVTVSTTNRRIRFASSAMSATASLTIEAKVVSSARTDLTASFTQSTVNGRIRFATPQLDAIATNLTAAFRNATGTVLLESVTAMTVIAQKITVQPITLSSAFTQNTDIKRFRDTSSSMSAEVSLFADIERIQAAGSNMSAIFTLSANTDNSKTTRFNSAMQTTAAAVVIIRRNRSTAVTATVLTTLIANNQVLRLASATLASEFQRTFVITRVVRITAVLQCQGFQIAVSDVFNIDAYNQLTIAQETRGFRILPESRIITIEQETRLNII
jgi:hypothetical protein